MPEEGLPGIGFPRWQVDLQRVRNGTPGSWQLEWAGGQFVPGEESMTATGTHYEPAGIYGNKYVYKESKMAG
jgi:hypothetical protein